MYLMKGNLYKAILLVLGLIILAFLFYNHKFFHDVKKFEDYKWHKSDKIVFAFEIDDTSKIYNIALNIRYITGFSYKYLPLNIEISNPDGKKLIYEAKIQLISDDKKYIGDGAGDYWDLDFPLPQYDFRKKGIYKITIEHSMNNDIAYPVNEIGISIIKKGKK